METVLETVGTGVVVVDAEGTVTALNAAACRLLDVDAAVVGRRARGGAARAGPRARWWPWCSGCSPAAGRARSARWRSPRAAATATWR